MINYPTKKTIYQKTVSNNTANRGMALEDMINKSNEYYLIHQIAYINKRPTPIKVFKTEKDCKIVDGIFLKPSTLDYVGIYKGHYLDFEAKETNSKKGFPMSNIAPHQIEAMQNVIKQKGITFAILFLKSYNEVYLLDGLYFIEAYNNKSNIIPYEKIVDNGMIIKENYHLPLDYIKAVQRYYFEEK